jgi:hypothetical protein
MNKKTTAKKTAARKSVSAPALPALRVVISAAHANFYAADGEFLDRLRNGAPGSSDATDLAAALTKYRKTHTVTVENV